MALLEVVQESVGSDFFFASLWQTVQSSPNVRLPAFLYVNNKFDRRKAMDDQLFVVGGNVNHMVGFSQNYFGIILVRLA